MEEKKYLTISALTKYIKRKYDADPYLSRVYVIGEVSNFRKRQGNQYFSLKDEHAKIKAMCLQHIYNKAGFDLEEGMKIIAVGRVGVYEASGEYQLYIEHLELSGTGALYQAYQDLRNKLQKEGLFTQPKQAIPKFPKKIAVVTSRSGAVIHDIQTTILRRYPIVTLHVYDTVVQGKESADSIVRNLQRIDNATHQYDTVIIARGGGSIEDLWSFNEEKVVHAIAACTIPVISSIGHETDTTLSDFVADLRVATPTAAAECAVPELQVVVSELAKLTHQLQRNVYVQLTQKKQHLAKLESSYLFQQPERLYDGYVQKYDYMMQLLFQRIQWNLQRQNRVYDQLERQFERVHLGAQLDESIRQHELLTEQLHTRFQSYQEQQKQRLLRIVQQLDLLSPLKSMARGYSYVTVNERVVSSVEQVKTGDELSIEMVDGTVFAQVKDIKVSKK